MMFKANRELLNVNFQGYKLSDTSLAITQEDLPCPVSEVQLKENEFSYQRMRAHTLHNHLHSDPYHPSFVYWCASDGSVRKVILDGVSVRMETVLCLPAPIATQRTSNITIEFLADNMGMVCAGGNEIALFCREFQDHGERWTIVKSLVLSGSNPLMLEAASPGVMGTHADILCAEISDPDPTSVGGDSKVAVATYKWVRVVFNTCPVQSRPCVEDVEITVLGTFGSKSLALYAAFQYLPSSTETQLLLISETTPLIDSGDLKWTERSSGATSMTEKDASLLSEAESHQGLGFQSDKAYSWTQTETDVEIVFELEQDIRKKDIRCIVEPGELVVGFTDGTTLLRGELMHSIDPDASNWTFGDNKMEVTLEKSVEGVMWKNLMKDLCSVDDHLPLSEGCLERDELSAEELERVKKMLARMTANTDDVESGSPSKRPCHMVHNMLEECDTSEDEPDLFVITEDCHLKQKDEPDPFVITEDCHLKQKVSLGGHPVVFTAPPPSRHSSYLCLRHDVDGVVWLPHASLANSQSRWSHATTFNALGYVQASKRERKFTTCSPNLKYAVICDGVRHVFVYMKPTEERRNSAVEYVHSLTRPMDLLGVVASDNGAIFLLTKKQLYVLKIPNLK